MATREQQLRAQYVGRINKVIDYIESNLDEDLSLEVLAKTAGFSRYHFHRIFSAMVGETLATFISRVRVERAATMLTSNPTATVTEVALDCGYSGSAAFARAFKDAFGMSASQWRKGKNREQSKIRKTDSKEGETIGKGGKEVTTELLHLGDRMNNPRWRLEMFSNNKKNELKANVEVKDMPDMNVAYVRHVGPYAGDEKLFEGLYGKLMGWAGPRGLIQFPETKCMCVYHDDPNVTKEDKLRVSVCMTVPERTQVDGEIGGMTIPGGKFAVARFEIDATQYGDAWTALMGGWMPESGYQPDDRLCYEMGLNNPKDHPEGKHIVDICVPVKPL